MKLGKEFFTGCGPEGVRAVAQHGTPVFLDLKFHDIPNTVAGAVRSTLPLRPFMLTVHALGGAAMMRAAATAAREAGAERPLVIAVTVLTSLGDVDLTALGLIGGPAGAARRLAALARESGLDGVVCSPLEAADLRLRFGADFRLVVPGIRPTLTADDQQRVQTPRGALASGADWLVIGRPITGAPDPVAAARSIAASLG